MTRLDCFLSDASGCSRKQAKAWLRAGRVTVDGAPTRNSSGTVDETACVCLDGRPLTVQARRYIMVNKPAGTVCTALHADPRSVLALFPSNRRHPLQCVGRLDVDTTGLLLVTDDGDWNHCVSRPGQILKVYRATLAGPLSDTAIESLQSGVELRNESMPALAHSLQRVDARTCLIGIREGRYHVVRRMFAAVGNRVVQLHRESIGTLTLDDGLAPGEWRELAVGERRID